LTSAIHPPGPIFLPLFVPAIPNPEFTKRRYFNSRCVGSLWTV